MRKEATAELLPNQIVRKKDGSKFFGYRPTTLQSKIDAGEIPAPIKLGDRAVGWLGSQILEWQEQLLKNSK